MVQNGSSGADKFAGKKGADIFAGKGGNDAAYGLDGNDRLSGDSGDDLLDGGAGDDYVFGGDGNDTLIGGEGYDYMSGGQGNDVFRFRELSFQGARPDPSGNLVSALIVGFKHGDDLIDLSLIDVDPTKSGDQAFKFAPAAVGEIGTKFTKMPGELIKEPGPGRISTYIAGDLNGDGKADFRIQIYSNVMLRPSDFKL